MMVRAALNISVEFDPFAMTGHLSGFAQHLAQGFVLR